MAHTNTQQRDEKYRQDHRGDFALLPLELALAVLGLVTLRWRRRREQPLNRKETVTSRGVADSIDFRRDDNRELDGNVGGSIEVPFIYK